MVFFFFILTIMLELIFTVPVYKVIIAEDLRNPSNRYDTKGLNLIIDPNSEFSILPYYVFNNIYVEFSRSFSECYLYTVDLPNGYKTSKCISYEKISFKTIYFITENFGIKIPSKYMFLGEKNFIFQTKENQENIIFGKDLIELMQINYENENDFVIHNKDFLILVDE